MLFFNFDCVPVFVVCLSASGLKYVVGFNPASILNPLTILPFNPRTFDPIAPPPTNLAAPSSFTIVTLALPEG